MSETATSYAPDFFQDLAPKGTEDFITEIGTSRSGREQRRYLYSTQYRRFMAATMPLDIPNRLALRNFQRSMKGRYGAFYFWNPFKETQEAFACGSVSAARYIKIPLRSTKPATGSDVVGTYTQAASLSSYYEIRLANVPFNYTTIRSLVPRTTTFSAVRMYGGAENINCGSDGTLRPTADQTYTAWVWRSSAASANYVLTNETQDAAGVDISIDANRKINFVTNQVGAHTTAVSTTAIPNETWTHIAVVKSGTGITFYINGVAAGTGTANNPITATVPFRIGATSSSWNGMLSEVRLYVTALSAGDVAAAAAGTATSVTAAASLYGWWRLTEGTGTATADASRASATNGGTLSSSTLWCGGEDEIDFGSNQTGAVTVWGQLRERLTCRFDSDLIQYGAPQQYATDFQQFAMALKEVV